MDNIGFQADGFEQPHQLDFIDMPHRPHVQQVDRPLAAQFVGNPLALILKERFPVNIVTHQVAQDSMIDDIVGRCNEAGPEAFTMKRNQLGADLVPGDSPPRCRYHRRSGPGRRYCR